MILRVSLFLIRRLMRISCRLKLALDHIVLRCIIFSFGKITFLVKLQFYNNLFF